MPHWITRLTGGEASGSSMLKGVLKLWLIQGGCWGLRGGAEPLEPAGSGVDVQVAVARLVQPPPMQHTRA